MSGFASGASPLAIRLGYPAASSERAMRSSPSLSTIRRGLPSCTLGGTRGLRRFRLRLLARGIPCGGRRICAPHYESAGNRGPYAMPGVPQSGLWSERRGSPRSGAQESERNRQRAGEGRERSGCGSPPRARGLGMGRGYPTDMITRRRGPKERGTGCRAR
jgi:hypothetical protein